MPFSLPVFVTQENASKLEKEGLLNIEGLTVIDCVNLKDFDSTVLTVMIAWQKTLQASKRDMRILNAPEKLKVLASVYGVAALLGLS